MPKKKQYLEKSGLVFESKKEMKIYLENVKLEIEGQKISKGHKYYDFMCDIFHMKYSLPSEDLIFWLKTYEQRRKDLDPITLDKHSIPMVRTRDSDWKGFSLKKALEPPKKSELEPNKEKIKKSFRNEIRPQIERFKKSNGEKPCSACRRMNRDYDIDHVLPFRVILNDFLSGEDLKIDNIEYLEPLFDMAPHEYILKDPLIRKKWYEYHEKNAKLQKLCKECHVKKTTKDIHKYDQK